MIASRLSHDIVVKVTATTCLSEITDLTYTLRASETTPSYIVESDEIHCVKIRLKEEGTEWSQNIHVAGDRLEENRMVKVSLLKWGRVWKSVGLYCKESLSYMY